MAGVTKNKSTVILDASAVLSELLPDESPPAHISKVFNQLSKLDIIIIAPLILKYEVGNSLKSAVLSKRITKPNAQKTYKKFLELGIQFIEINYFETLKLALKQELSFYDASYVYLSRKQKAPLISFDKKHYKLN
jgi:predicted nucleic acid-binding protein